MSKRRETATMVGQCLDDLGGKPVAFEVYADNGEWVDPSLVPAPALVDPADAPITVTRSELADIVAAAAAAAVNAHAAGASPTTMRAAALRAVE